MKAFVTYLKKNLRPCSWTVGQLVGLNCQTASAGTLATSTNSMPVRLVVLGGFVCS